MMEREWGRNALGKDEEDSAREVGVGDGEEHRGGEKGKRVVDR